MFMLKNDVMAVIVVRFSNEIDMALALDMLRKNKIEQKLVSRTIKTANKNFRLLSPCLPLHYNQLPKYWRKVKKINEHFERGNFPIKIEFGYIDLYHVVFFNEQANFTNLYFDKQIYQSMQLLRKPLEWEKTEYCHEVFLDYRSIVFCDDLYRLLKREEL